MWITFLKYRNPDNLFNPGKLIKRYLPHFSIPALNFGTITYSIIPSFNYLEEIFKLLLLVATFVYTVIKIYLLIKNRRVNSSE